MRFRSLHGLRGFQPRPSEAGQRLVGFCARTRAHPHTHTHTQSELVVSSSSLFTLRSVQTGILWMSSVTFQQSRSECTQDLWMYSLMLLHELSRRSHTRSSRVQCGYTRNNKTPTTYELIRISGFRRDLGVFSRYVFTLTIGGLRWPQLRW